MKFGRVNIITGAVVIFIATFAGFAMGKTLDGNFTEGFYKMSFARALAKAGHTHGMLFAYFNLIVGGLVDRLELTDKLKKWLSALAIGALLLPIGVATRGIMGGSAAPEPVAMLGALCYLSAAALILKGALAMKTN
jgi:hypothetical protein